MFSYQVFLALLVDKDFEDLQSWRLKRLGIHQHLQYMRHLRRLSLFNFATHLNVQSLSYLRYWSFPYPTMQPIANQTLILNLQKGFEDLKKSICEIFVLPFIFCSFSPRAE